MLVYRLSRGGFWVPSELWFPSHGIIRAIVKSVCVCENIDERSTLWVAYGTAKTFIFNNCSASENIYPSLCGLVNRRVGNRKESLEFSNQPPQFYK